MRFSPASYWFIFLVVFFFQAEDGIRDGHVTGVQTCALPICVPLHQMHPLATHSAGHGAGYAVALADAARSVLRLRSEERRVGKEWRAGGGRGAENRKERKGMGGKRRTEDESETRHRCSDERL